VHSPDDLPQIIRELLPGDASGDLLIAFSGGLDSTVLLHALAHPPRGRVRAVHVNHGLHPEAGAWQRHCERVARALEVEFHARTVTVPADADQGVESAARGVRYDALRALLAPGETLLTAHHADDQLETVLLALMRGSGVDGLASMPRCRRFGEGWHARPLLEFTRDELVQWARAQGLAWLDDPSNDSARFDRNYLRHAVIPALRTRWPAAAHAASRSASHFATASALLDGVAAHDLASAAVGACLKVSALRLLDAARRRNLLRYWLKSCGARSPSTRKLAALEHDMLHADPDRLPCVHWDDVEVRRHRDLLYCMRSLPHSPVELEWPWRSPLVLAGIPGVLHAQIAHGRGLRRAALPDRLHVRPRTGGERLRLPGHAHRRELKKLLQEANVLPWWRERLPLIYAGDTLIAVADLWIAAEYAAGADEEGVVLIWEERPRMEA